MTKQKTHAYLGKLATYHNDSITQIVCRFNRKMKCWEVITAAYDKTIEVWFVRNSALKDKHKALLRSFYSSEELVNAKRTQSASKTKSPEKNNNNTNASSSSGSGSNHQTPRFRKLSHQTVATEDLASTIETFRQSASSNSKTSLRSTSNTLSNSQDGKLTPRSMIANSISLSAEMSSYAQDGEASPSDDERSSLHLIVESSTPGLRSVSSAFKRSTDFKKRRISVGRTAGQKIIQSKDSE